MSRNNNNAFTLSNTNLCSHQYQLATNQRLPKVENEKCIGVVPDPFPRHKNLKNKRGGVKSGLATRD